MLRPGISLAGLQYVGHVVVLCIAGDQGGSFSRVIISSDALQARNLQSKTYRTQAWCCQTLQHTQTLLKQKREINYFTFTYLADSFSHTGTNLTYVSHRRILKRKTRQGENTSIKILHYTYIIKIILHIKLISKSKIDLNYFWQNYFNLNTSIIFYIYSFIIPYFNLTYVHTRTPEGLFSLTYTSWELIHKKIE